MAKQIRIVFFFLASLSINSHAAYKNIPTLLQNKNILIENQYQNSLKLLIQNLSPSDGKKGAVIAAPSKSHPDYYYNWVRDAALTAESLIYVYSHLPTRSPLKLAIKNFLLDYVDYNIEIQKFSKEMANLGEPKFYADGSLFTGPWGRPQNDGPALRSSSGFLILSLAAQERWPEYSSLLNRLYISSLSKSSMIKDDLEFVAHHWKDANFDLWEEVYGLHFYTLMAQRRSLYMGAIIANYMKDSGANQFYQDEMQKINARLDSFWSANQGFILATEFSFFSARSLPHARTKSFLDVAVILGVLHSEVSNYNFSVTDPRVFSTYLSLKKVFSNIYSINKEKTLNTSFGRYPEDTYDGYVTTGRGNPWVLSTTGAAEYLYRLSIAYLKNQKIPVDFANVNYYSQVVGLQLNQGQTISRNQPEFKKIISHLVDEGDLYMLRVLYHSNPDGSLSEQFNRENGYMQGAPNLTWSHASFLTAKLYRDQILNAIRKR